jgi:hypothetical protein
LGMFVPLERRPSNSTEVLLQILIINSFILRKLAVGERARPVPVAQRTMNFLLLDLGDASLDWSCVRQKCTAPPNQALGATPSDATYGIDKTSVVCEKSKLYPVNKLARRGGR